MIVNGTCFQLLNTAVHLHVQSFEIEDMRLSISNYKNLLRNVLFDITDENNQRVIALSHKSCFLEMLMADRMF
jgi:hypothetical protein